MSVSDDAQQAGREDRFRVLYEANYHRILGFALRRAPEADAADVVAETFLVAWRRLDEVPVGEAARLWLYGTARRVLANHDRASRRRARLVQRAGAAESHQVTDCYLAQDGAAAKAFGGLRDRDREILSLSAWEGLDAAEIARVCGCSRNAARIRLHRARRRFAGELVRLESTPSATTPQTVGRLPKEEPL